MTIPLRVLILEDRPADAELLLHELRQSGFDPEWQRVETEEEYLAALHPALDIILSDYGLPQFDGLRALQLLRARGLDIPFILISGTIGEDIAVECIKQGADDYLLKDRLTRLGPAVKSALERKRLRDERKLTEEELRESEDRYRDLVENSQDLICTHDLEGKLLSVNEAAVRLTGYSRDALLQMNMADLLVPDVRRTFGAYLKKIRATGQASGLMQIQTASGENRFWQYNNTLRAEGMVVPIVRGMAHDITARKQAEDALRASKLIIEGIINAIPVRVFWKDKNLVYLGCNAAFARDKGFTDPKDVIGKDDYQMARRDQAELYRGDDRQVIESGSSKFFIEEPQTTPEGNIITLLTSKVPLRSSKGEVIGVIGTYMDITERKQAEEALRRDEALLLQTGKMAKVGGWELDLPSMKLLWSLETYHIHEVDPSFQPDLESAINFYAPEARPIINEAVRKASEEGTPYDLELPFITAKGRHIWVRAIGQPEFRDGKCVRLFGAFQDITERKQVEVALRQAEEKYRSIFESAVVGIYQTTPEGHYLMANPTLARTFGYESPEALLQAVNDLNRQFYVEPGRRAEFIRRIEEQDGVSDFESQVYRQDGSVMWISENARAIRDASGRLVGFEGTTVDITDRKKAEKSQARLAAAIEATSDFVAIADLDGRPLYLNKTGKEMLGIGEDEDISSIEISAAHPKWAGELVLNEGIPTALRDGIWRGETALLTRDGREVPVLQVIVAPRSADGTVEFHATIMRDITERKQAEAALLARARQQAAVAQLGQRALANTDLDILLTEAVALTAQTLEVEYSKVLELLPGGETLQLRAGVGWKEGYVGHATLSADTSSQAGYTLLTNEPVIMEDLRTETRFSAPPLLNEHGVVSGMSVVIRSQDRSFGVLGAHTVRPRTFTLGDVDFLQSIANVLAAAIERKRAEEDIQRQLQRITALRAIDQAIAGSMDVNFVFKVILDHVISQLAVDAAVILLYNPAAQALEYATGRGFRTEALQHTRLPLGEGYAGRAALARQMVHIPNLRGRKTDFLRSPTFSQEGFVSYFGVPLMAKGEIKGVLEVFHRSAFEADTEWLNFLETLAGQTAIAIDNATLFKGLQLSNIELSMAYDATIEGWSRALDLRDKETEGHTQRVAEMSQRLARAMRINEAELVNMRRGALLHDIGKMGVPDAILLKAGQLTDEEWVIMRQHPQFAYDMLSPIAYLKPALDIPYCHHEKWDGSGYPRGLKGEGIPLAARIFAVVDVYDALTSDRPYREAWSKEKTLEYIREQSDTYFDPQVIEAFMEMLRTE